MPTVLEVIKSTTAWFEKRGIESPRLNAEHLAAHALGKKARLDLYMEFDRPLGESDLAPMRELVRKRGEGIPLQHLLGTSVFFGREFLCDARGLVPRPETEQLVELVLSTLNSQLSTRILDVGTGSGVIAITLALELPESSVSAIDISPDALALAQENATKLGANIACAAGDLLPDTAGEFDLIVANLPYIPTAEIPALSREVQHDPAGALDGGPDGLDLVRRLAEQATTRLSSGGKIFFEIGLGQAAATAECLAAHGYRETEIRKDLAGIERFVIASR